MVLILLNTLPVVEYNNISIRRSSDGCQRSISQNGKQQDSSGKKSQMLKSWLSRNSIILVLVLSCLIKLHFHLSFIGDVCILQKYFPVNPTTFKSIHFNFIIFTCTFSTIILGTSVDPRASVSVTVPRPVCVVVFSDLSAFVFCPLVFRVLRIHRSMA